MLERLSITVARPEDLILARLTAGVAVDLRELKGLEIAARCRIEFADGAWRVPSQTGNGRYTVKLKPGEESCSCEDFSLTGKPCKHVHAARLACERDHGGKAP